MRYLSNGSTRGNWLEENWESEEQLRNAHGDQLKRDQIRNIS